MEGVRLKPEFERMDGEEERAALAWRGRLRAARRRNVYTTPSSVKNGNGPGVVGAAAAWHRLPSHHGRRPVMAPAQSAVRAASGKEDLSTDWPYTARAITTAGTCCGMDGRLRRLDRSVPDAPVLGAAGGQLSVAPPAQAKYRSPEDPHQPYHWVPTQAQLGHSMHLKPSTLINSLSLEVGFDDGEWFELQPPALRPGERGFSARAPPHCCLLGCSFVVCWGILVGTVPQEDDTWKDGDAGVTIAVLPDGLRPPRHLRFAAQACPARRRQKGLAPPPDVAAALVTLSVSPEGHIRAAAKLETTGAIDLSAVRFSLNPGIAIADEVVLTTCDVAGGRFVALQGQLSRRAFAGPDLIQIAMLPSNCRPADEVPFVFPGSRPGNFHLVSARSSERNGIGAVVFWRDSKWEGVDTVHLSGMVYRVAPEALELPTNIRPLTPERQFVILADFAACLEKRFGTIEAAWRLVFDPDAAKGTVDFTRFCAGCKSASFKGNVSRVWWVLDENLSGKVSLEEFQRML